MRAEAIWNQRFNYPTPVASDLATSIGHRSTCGVLKATDLLIYRLAVSSVGYR